MTVQQLKYILKVAEVGSITEAAKTTFYITAKSLQFHQRNGKRGRYHHLSSVAGPELL